MTNLTVTDEIRDVIHRTARFDRDAVTFGTYAEGGDVSLSPTDHAGARSLVVTGGSGTGKTALLRSLYAGAADAGIQTRALVDPYQSDAAAVVERYRTHVTGSLGDPSMSLLLVDDLAGFGDDTLAALEQVARFARKANVVLVVASQDVRLGGRGGDVLRHLADAPLIQFAELWGTPGVGQVNGDLFRAWYAA